MSNSNLPQRDIMKCEDPCEYGRNRAIPKGYGSLRTFEQQDIKESSNRFKRPDDVGYVQTFSFEDEDLSIRRKTSQTNQSSSTRKSSGMIDLSCPQTLEYYFQRDQAKAKSIEVYDPIVVEDPYKITAHSKSKYCKNGSMRKAVQRERYLVA